MTQDNELAYKANKIFLFYKDDMIYSWYISLTDVSHLIGRRRVDLCMYLKRSHYTSKDSGDVHFLVKKVIDLLKDDYSIVIDKNKSGIVLKNKVLKKYISLLKKYYGKNEEVDFALNNFLRHYSIDNIVIIQDVMTDINYKIKQLNNKITYKFA